MKSIILTALWILVGYLFGSISWGLLIGKVFYHKDIREYGSGNLGGTNAARVLGLPVGITVIALDALKALIAMAISHAFYPGIEQYVGLAVCIGHCFPVFAGFRGGKAVASSYGYLLGLALFVTKEYVYTFLLPVLVFFVILLAFRMVSLGSMCGVTSAALFLLIKGYTGTGLLVLALAAFVIYRHSANIKRILNHQESKIFSKKK